MTPEDVAILNEVMRNPLTANSLPAKTVENLLGHIAIVQGVLVSRLLALRAQTPNGSGAGLDDGDRLLKVDEAAQKLGVSTDHLYRHADKYPFTVRIEGNLRFSRMGIEKFIQQRRGR